MSPIKLQFIDETGEKLLEVSVPFSFGFNVKQIMEAAFVISQKPNPTDPDPFLYTLEYYGYNENPDFAGYLGYEIESFGLDPNNMKATTSNYFWALSIGGNPSKTGAETTFPPPGSIVTWKYTRIPANLEELPPRAKAVHSRRAARAPKN